MNKSNVIKVKSLENESTGYFFQSYDDKSSFVIATKHGICDKKNTCKSYQDAEVHCCRSCHEEFNKSNIELLHGQIKLKIVKIYYEKSKDLVIIQVSENSNDKLIVNQKRKSDKYNVFGFMKKNTGLTRLVVDVPTAIDTLTLYNLYSDPTPNLEEKSTNYKGISGSIIFTEHESHPTAKGLMIENGNQNDLVAENLDTLNFEEINVFFECNVFDRTLFKFSLKNNLKEYLKVIESKRIANELEIIIYVPKKIGFPHFDISDISNSISEEYYQIFLAKKKGVKNSFLHAQAGFLISENRDLDPINKLLSARVAEAYLNAPHLYSTSLNEKIYHHTHYLFINDGYDLAISFFCGHNSLESNIQNNMKNIIDNANKYKFNQNLLLERSFLDQNFEKEICDHLFNILFEEESRIKNFCLVFTISMEDFHDSDHSEIDDYIKYVVRQACDKINNETLKKLKLGLNLHVIVIPINKENEISDKFLEDLTGGS